MTRGSTRLLAAVARGRWVPFYDPTRDPVRRLALGHARAYARIEIALWTAALVFVVADVATTLLGLPHPAVVERVAMTRWALRFGWPGLLAKQCAVVLLIGGLWLALPRPYRAAIPGTAAAAGYVATNNNVAVLLAHGIVTPP